MKIYAVEISGDRGEIQLGFSIDKSIAEQKAQEWYNRWYEDAFVTEYTIDDGWCDFNSSL